MEKRRRMPNRIKREAKPNSTKSGNAVDYVPPIPVPEGKYLDQLLDLKEEAFAQIQMTRNVTGDACSQRGKVCSLPRFPKPITSYQAFTEYNSCEFYNAPFEIVTKFLARAWESCPNKDVWEYYAYVFNKANTSSSFRSWLDSCPKRPMLLIVQEPYENYQ